MNLEWDCVLVCVSLVCMVWFANWKVWQWLACVFFHRIHRSRQWNNTDGISKHMHSPYNAHYLNYTFFTHSGSSTLWIWDLKLFEVVQFIQHCGKLLFASVIVWTQNKNVTISDRFNCFLTVKRRWRPVFWGRQLNKVVNSFDEKSASRWPGWRIFWPRNDLAPLLRWRRHWSLVATWFGPKQRCLSRQKALHNIRQYTVQDFSWHLLVTVLIFLYHKSCCQLVYICMVAV